MINRRKYNLLRRTLSIVFCLLFTLTNVKTNFAQSVTFQAQTKSAFLPFLSGITVHPDNPLELDFIVNDGNKKIADKILKSESEKIIKYFLASLTVPENEMWVNLSPKENNRIITDSLGKTTLGKDLLEQDYLLKKLTASLTSPEKDLGEKFWARIKSEAQKKYGTADFDINNYNKVWITPDKAVVYEYGNSAFVVNSHLKIMTEEDHKTVHSSEFIVDREDPTMNHEPSTNISAIMKELIVPAIEKEVNEGETFAPLRQIYSAMILAVWYKMNLQESLLSKTYVDQNKVQGVSHNDPKVIQKTYEDYLQLFQNGVNKITKDEYDPQTQQIASKTYFSGGAVGVNKEIIQRVKNYDNLSEADKSALPKENNSHLVNVSLIPEQKNASSTIDTDDITKNTDKSITHELPVGFDKIDFLKRVTGFESYRMKGSSLEYAKDVAESYELNQLYYYYLADALEEFQKLKKEFIGNYQQLDNEIKSMIDRLLIRIYDGELLVKIVEYVNNWSSINSRNPTKPLDSAFLQAFMQILNSLDDNIYLKHFNQDRLIDSRTALVVWNDYDALPIGEAVPPQKLLQMSNQLIGEIAEEFNMDVVQHKENDSLTNIGLAFKSNTIFNPKLGSLPIRYKNLRPEIIDWMFLKLEKAWYKENHNRKGFLYNWNAKEDKSIVNNWLDRLETDYLGLFSLDFISHKDIVKHLLHDAKSKTFSIGRFYGLLESDLITEKEKRLKEKGGFSKGDVIYSINGKTDGIIYQEQFIPGRLVRDESVKQRKVKGEKIIFQQKTGEDYQTALKWKLIEEWQETKEAVEKNDVTQLKTQLANLLEAYDAIEKLGKSDRAIVSDKAPININDNVGGIDLRREKWNLEIIRSYQTQIENTFKFDPALIQIDGLTPFIINIQPINVNQLLGLKSSDVNERLTYNYPTK